MGSNVTPKTAAVYADAARAFALEAAQAIPNWAVLPTEQRSLLLVILTSAWTQGAIFALDRSEKLRRSKRLGDI